MMSNMMCGGTYEVIEVCLHFGSFNLGNNNIDFDNIFSILSIYSKLIRKAIKQTISTRNIRRSA